MHFICHAVIVSWREAATTGPFGFSAGECIKHLILSVWVSWPKFRVLICSRQSSSSGSSVVEDVVLSPQLFCYIVVSVQGAGLCEDVRMNSVLCCEHCRISCCLQVRGIMQTVTFYRLQNRNQLLFYSGDELNIVIFGACKCFFFFFF